MLTQLKSVSFFGLYSMEINDSEALFPKPVISGQPILDDHVGDPLKS